MRLIVSFADSAEGNKQAEELFIKLVRETASDTSNEAIEAYLEDGYCKIGEGFVAIVHSRTEPDYLSTGNLFTDMYAALEAAYELATSARHDGDDVAALIRQALAKAKGGAA